MHLAPFFPPPFNLSTAQFCLYYCLFGCAPGKLNRWKPSIYGRRLAEWEYTAHRRDLGMNFVVVSAVTDTVSVSAAHF